MCLEKVGLDIQVATSERLYIPSVGSQSGPCDQGQPWTYTSGCIHPEVDAESHVGGSGGNERNALRPTPKQLAIFRRMKGGVDDHRPRQLVTQSKGNCVPESFRLHW